MAAEEEGVLSRQGYVSVDPFDEIVVPRREHDRIILRFSCAHGTRVCYEYNHHIHQHWN